MKSCRFWDRTRNLGLDSCKVEMILLKPMCTNEDGGFWVSLFSQVARRYLACLVNCCSPSVVTRTAAAYKPTIRINETVIKTIIFTLIINYFNPL